MKTDRKIEKKKSPTKEAFRKLHFHLTRLSFWGSGPKFSTPLWQVLLFALLGIVTYLIFALIALAFGII